MNAGDDLAVKTDELTRTFGSFQAVSAVNLQVKKGRFYGFLGPNGAKDLNRLEGGDSSKHLTP